MKTGLEGKTVLITGAGRNIGRRSAELFAEDGANLVLCTSKNREGLNETAASCEKLGAKVITQLCDVTDEAGVAKLFEAGRKEFGAIDVLVNNAVYRNENDLMEMSVDEWNRNIAVNLTGPFHTCRQALPQMVEREWGRIVNFSGIAPYNGHFAAKAMVKLGIVGFTRGIARDYGPKNITANCVAPGFIQVERDAFQADKGVVPEQVIRRPGTPDEIGGLVVFLASDKAGYITGQSYLINGGRYFQ